MLSVPVASRDTFAHFLQSCFTHYNDVIMGALASQITSLTIVYSTVYSDADQRKHQSSVSLAFVRGIHRGPVNSPHKWPVTRKMFPFDDVIMGIGAILIQPQYQWSNRSVSQNWSFTRGIHRWPVDSSSKGLKMQKACPRRHHVRCFLSSI